MADHKAGEGASANLDFLRSVAVLSVLVVHTCTQFNVERKFGLNNLALFGVLVFFVHTSLVLMYSLQRSAGSGIALFRSFYIRRFFRLYPLSILIVLAALALHLHAVDRGLALAPRPRPLEIVSNLLLVQNLTGSDSIVGPMWTLPIEVQMYVLLPLLFVWRRRSLWTLLVLWGVTAVLGHFPQAAPIPGWLKLLLFSPNFLPGMIAFTLPKRPVLPAYLWPPFVLGLFLFYSQYASWRTGAELCLLLGITIPLFKELTFRPLTFISNRIATYSYGIYLAQSFCIWFGFKHHHSWMIFVPTMVMVPIVLYHALEHPAIKLGRRLARDSQPQPAPIPEEAPAGNIARAAHT